MQALLLDKCEFSKLPPESLSKSCVWADFSPEEAHLLSSFGISSDHWRRNEQRHYPRYIEHEKYTSIIFFEFDPGAPQRKSRLHIYLGKNFILTLGCRKHMDSFYQNLVKEKGMRKAKIEDALLYVISEASYVNSDLIRRLEEDVARIEEETRVRQNQAAFSHIFNTKRSLVKYGRFFWRERELVFALKNNQVQFFAPDEQMRGKLDELYNSMLFDINSVETLREILSDTLDIFHMSISNRINETIRRLTLVTVILTIVATISMVPNTVATIFGIPYLPWEAGVPVTSLFGADLYPWEIIVFLLIFFSVVPALVIYAWWKGFEKRK